MDAIVIVSIIILFLIVIVITVHTIKIYLERKKMESDTPIITNLLSHKSVNSDYNLI